MPDDPVNAHLLQVLRQRLQNGKKPKSGPHDDETRVLQDALLVTDNAIDVVIDPFKTKEAAEMIYRMMQRKRYSTKSWAEHPLHPQTKDESTVHFIFTMDLLNFSFWSDETDKEKQFAVEYRGQRWNGYSSLVASLQRALDEDIPITTPSFWIDEEKCTEELLRHVFRSATPEQIPMFDERVQCLREAGKTLCDRYDGSFTNCLKEAQGRAEYLVNLLADDFACFRDVAHYHGKEIRFYKRAQILVADIWACFNGKDWGKFNDIDDITMFADYRVPQILKHMGCLRYSPPLEMMIRDKKLMPAGSQAEVEIRASTIRCVDAICREIRNRHRETAVSAGECAADSSRPSRNTSPAKKGSPNAVEATDETATPPSNDPKAQGGQGDKEEEVKVGVNAILIDFLLYDTMKEIQAAGEESMPHHRTRSIWY